MKTFQLKAARRTEVGKKVRKRRKLGYIPAVIYGSGSEPQHLEVEYLVFNKLFREAGEANLVDLSVDDGQPTKVLIHDIQTHPLTHDFLHVDFYKVDMNKPITTEIPLHVIGQSDAIKSLGGTLVKNYQTLKVECLPGQLVPLIEVDISPISTFDKVVKVKDLKLPDGYKVLVDPEESVVLVTPPRTEAELAALEEKPVEKVEQVEVIGEKEKKEAAVAAEAAAAPSEEKKKS